MAKKKKFKENLRHFYRGPVLKPPKVATELELTIIHETIARTKDKTSTARLAIGLSASLRSLKQGKALAIIYDASVSPHLANYLRFFASKISIPVIQADNLSKPAAKLKLRTILAVCVVAIDVASEMGALINHLAQDKSNKLEFRPPVEERTPVGRLM